MAWSKKSSVEVLQNEAGSRSRWVAHGEEAMLPVVSLEEVRIGSRLWAMTRHHARLVVRDTRGVEGVRAALALRTGRPRYDDVWSDSDLRDHHYPFLFDQKFEPWALVPFMSIASKILSNMY